MTPEGRVKAAINKTIKLFGDRVYKHMPVPSGYGMSTLDYLLCVNGRFLGIEAKRDGGEPTDRQMQMMREIRNAGGVAICVNSVSQAAGELYYVIKEMLRASSY
jgi:hypothetical protein